MPAPRPRRPAASVRRPSPAEAGDAAGVPPDAATATRVGPRENALHSPEYRDMLIALQQAREASGLTLEQVADLLGKPISYVWKSEHGERRVDAVELWRFAGLYGRVVSDFLPRRPYTSPVEPPPSR